MRPRWSETRTLVEVHRSPRLPAPSSPPARRHPERRARTDRSRKNVLGPGLPARTHAFDPGYEPPAVAEHLDQCAHLLASLKVAVRKAARESSREKIALARSRNLPVVGAVSADDLSSVGGAARLAEALALCAEIGASRVEVGAALAGSVVPAELTARARDLGLDVHVELRAGERGRSLADGAVLRTLIGQGHAWIDAGAAQLALKVHGLGMRSSEPERTEGLFAAAHLAEALGLERVALEAPTRQVQMAYLNLFGREVRLCDVRLEELLHLESLRHGLADVDGGGPARTGILSASRS